MHAFIAETSILSAFPYATNVTARATLDLQVTEQAAASAYADDFLLMTSASVLLIPVALLLRSTAVATGPRPA
jgi:hypothetical protein